MSALTFAGVLFSLIALVVAIALLGFEDRARRRIIADYRDQNGRILKYNDTLARQLHNDAVGDLQNRVQLGEDWSKVTEDRVYQLEQRLAYLETYVGEAYQAPRVLREAKEQPEVTAHRNAHGLPVRDAETGAVSSEPIVERCAHCGKGAAVVCRDCYALRYERRTPGGTSYGSPKGYSLIATKAVKVKPEGDYPSVGAVVDGFAAEGCDFFVLQAVLDHPGAYAMQIYKAAQ